jgi:hypothetical protein
VTVHSGRCRRRPRRYLERSKKKYTSGGQPTYTKLELAARADEDGRWDQSTK